MQKPGLWSRSRWSRMFSAGVGVVIQVGVVFFYFWSRSRVFKNAGVGVGILKNLPTPQPWQRHDALKDFSNVIHQANTIDYFFL